MRFSDEPVIRGPLVGAGHLGCSGSRTAYSCGGDSRRASPCQQRCFRGLERAASRLTRLSPLYLGLQEDTKMQPSHATRENLLCSFSSIREYQAATCGQCEKAIGEVIENTRSGANLNAYITETPNVAQAQATESDSRISLRTARAPGDSDIDQGQLLYCGHPHNRRL